MLLSLHIATGMPRRWQSRMSSRCVRMAYPATMATSYSSGYRSARQFFVHRRAAVTSIPGRTPGNSFQKTVRATFGVGASPVPPAGKCRDVFQVPRRPRQVIHHAIVVMLGLSMKPQNPSSLAITPAQSNRPRPPCNHFVHRRFACYDNDGRYARPSPPRSRFALHLGTPADGTQSLDRRAPRPEKRSQNSASMTTASSYGDGVFEGIRPVQRTHFRKECAPPPALRIRTGNSPGYPLHPRATRPGVRGNLCRQSVRCTATSASS